MALHAVRVALQLEAEPRITGSLIVAPLPEGMMDLLKLAAGSTEAQAEWSGTIGVPGDALTQASRFFIEQVLMSRGADHYRVLGAARDAAHDTIREHYRWLIHWLHPDREASGWHSVLAERANRAYAELRTPEQRAAYDRSLAQPAVAAPVTAVRRRSVLQPALGEADATETGRFLARRWWKRDPR